MLKKFSQVLRITGLTILHCTEKFHFGIDAWFSQVRSQLVNSFPCVELGRASVTNVPMNDN